MQDGLFDHLPDDHGSTPSPTPSSADHNDPAQNQPTSGATDTTDPNELPNRELGEGGLFSIRGGAGKNMRHISAPPMKAFEKGDETAGANRVLRFGIFMAIIITLLFSVLIYRVAQLQTNPEERLVKQLGRNYAKVPLLERRGTITDRKGRPLAVSRIKKKLFIDPKLIADRGIFTDIITHEFGYDPLWIDKLMSRNPKSRYVVIDKALTDERLETFKRLKLSGLALDDAPVRDYPQGKTAGAIIGFVGDEGVGLSGLELALDKRLTGQKGKFVYMRDSRGRAIGIDSERFQPNQNGENIRLSIDSVIQSMAEDVLDRLTKHFNSPLAMMVVINPRTGEILAMASTPSFDPRTFRTANLELQKNRCVTDVFEPGSIFKPIIWSGITQLGKVKPGETFTTEQGRWTTSYGRLIRDATTPKKSKYTWEEVLVNSSNIGMGKATNRITLQQLHEIVSAFGFGKKTGSNLPGEVSGLFPSWQVWNRRSTEKGWKNYTKHSIPFGQQISVTALQITTAIAAIANDGILIQPTIEARDPFAPMYVEKRVLSTPVAQFTREVMRRQILEGGGRNAISNKYEFFGKTGTAQLVNPGKGYFQDRYFSSFVAGAPLDDPQLVIGCFVKDPDKSVAHYGGQVATPAVREVMEASLQYLGIPPKTTDEIYKAEKDWPKAQPQE
ncbi:Peptidoglycan D,D-transpeptidase FtsI [Poriferisphaera corsica]|uniref:Peptidoglycan D,D-transpeptidase FtsI n=1 Tax=Poriferisphaera corsica TaxID=2528020 RepID=A0A517YSD4_9BACT|nr:penicillin-binding protein 2 [Poriferisphaera corsica]QDU33126.1 Peptidoglycan D,D-transpeptidase FtsI [Poriferisphaera corsica]